MRPLAYLGNIATGAVIAASVAAQPFPNEGIEGKIQYAQTAPRQVQLVMKQEKGYHLSINGIPLLHPLAQLWPDVCNHERLRLTVDHYGTVTSMLDKRIAQVSGIEREIEMKRKADTLFELELCGNTPPSVNMLPHKKIFDTFIQTYSDIVSNLKCDGNEIREFEKLPARQALQILTLEQLSVTYAMLASGYSHAFPEDNSSPHLSAYWNKAEEFASKVIGCYPPYQKRQQDNLKIYRNKIEDVKKRHKEQLKDNKPTKQPNKKILVA